VPVLHAAATIMTSTDEKEDGQVPGLLEMLAQVPDPRKRRGRRFPLVFILAVAVACALAGARSFREAGDHAADLPQELLRRLDGKPHPLLRRIIAPSETRIRTLVHAIGADSLDEITGGWLRDLADAGQPGGLPAAIAIDGKWLRGVLDGQVKLFAAMLHEEKVIIAQHRIPDDTTEVTQVKELLEPVDLENAVVTADAGPIEHRQPIWSTILPRVCRAATRASASRAWLSGSTVSACGRSLPASTRAASCSSRGRPPWAANDSPVMPRSS